MIVAQPKEAIAEFVKKTIGETQPYENYSAIGLVKNDLLVAGAIYNHYNGSDININFAAEPGARWMTREFLYACFDYPFNQLTCRRASVLVPKKNKTARKFTVHLGFEYEGNMRKALPNDDMIIYGLLKENCKWLDTLQQAA